MISLENKVSVITGASAGIGRATALLFAAKGAAIILNGRGQEKLEETAQEIKQLGGKVFVVPGDISAVETHERLAAVATQEFGGLDIAFNNAASLGPIGPLADIDIDAWRTVLSTNLTSAFLAARWQIPLMLKRGGGSLIFTSSFVGNSVGLPGLSAYGTTKAALLGMVKGITADYGALGIRANALLPGGTDTAMAGGPEQKEWAAGLHALKRLAQPEEIAQAALFLASSMSSFVAGAALYADGGNAVVK